MTCLELELCGFECALKVQLYTLFWLYMFDYNNSKMFALIRNVKCFFFVSCEYTDKPIGYKVNFKKKILATKVYDTDV